MRFAGFDNKIKRSTLLFKHTPFMAIIALLLSLLTGNVQRCDSYIASKPVSIEIIVNRAISATCYKEFASAEKLNSNSLSPVMMTGRTRAVSFQNRNVLERNKGPTAGKHVLNPYYKVYQAPQSSGAFLQQNLRKKEMCSTVAPYIMYRVFCIMHSYMIRYTRYAIQIYETFNR